MSRHLFIDLDRTLFRTTEFDQQRWQLLEQWFPEVVSAEQERPRQYEFFVHSGELYAYEFTAHLQALGLDVSAVLERLRQSALADGRLEYEGTAQLIAWAQQQGEVTVLTYGPDEYQRLKAALCPSLREVTVVTTLRPKHEYFYELTLEGEVWMVDDKPIGDELPAGVRFIQAAGYNALPVPDGAAWPVATTLADVSAIIEQQR